MLKLAKLEGKPEIFHTIQGEGKNLGKPSIFIRTSLCNLHCTWCDTDYTWNWENTPFESTNNIKYKKQDYIIEKSVDEVIDEVKKINCKHIVLTGGEPLMHQNELVELMKKLNKNKIEYTFEIETNGTLTPTNEFNELINQYNISPKLSNSNNSKKLRLKSRPLSFFSKNAKSNFKFVIAEKNDLNEVLDLQDEFDIKPQSIFLMPEGTSPENLKSKQEWLVDICKKHNFNYTDRLHIHIFGAKRGV